MNASVEQELVEFALSLAEASRSIVRAAARSPGTIHAKEDASPVTDVDRAVEQRLRELIEARYPTHGVLGEEYGAHLPEAEDVWVLDPIDGTKAFMVGLPAYGTLIALARGGVPVLGIIDQPVTGERWLGCDGAGTTYNGDAVRTRPCAALANAVVCTTSPEYFVDADLAAYQRLAAAARWTVYGGNCYVFGRLAAGFVDVAFEAQVDPYDFCALVPVVTNAGGAMSDWAGRPLALDSGDRIVATGDPTLHPKVLGCLNP